MKLTALADLPNRIKAGESFDENDVMAGLLIRAGVAETASDDPPKVKRAYRKRDLPADE